MCTKRRYISITFKKRNNKIKIKQLHFISGVARNLAWGGGY